MCEDGVARSKFENGYDKTEEVNFNVSSQSLRFKMKMKYFNRKVKKVRKKELVQVPPPLREDAAAASSEDIT